MGVIYGYRILSITVAILYVPPPRYDAIEHLGRNNVAEYIISMAGGYWWSDSNSIDQPISGVGVDGGD